jgi:hypothetical protein
MSELSKTERKPKIVTPTTTKPREDAPRSHRGPAKADPKTNARGATKTDGSDIENPS